MDHAAILLGISCGVSLAAGSFGALAAVKHGVGEAANRPPQGVLILFGAALLLVLCFPIAAFSGETVLLKTVLLLTAAFAIAGAVLGFRASTRRRA